MRGLTTESAEHVECASNRRKWLAALGVINAREALVPVRVAVEVHAHAALSFGDWCLAACAPRFVRTAAPGGYQDVCQESPQKRIAPRESWHAATAAPTPRRYRGARSTTWRGWCRDQKFPSWNFRAGEWGRRSEMKQVFNPGAFHG